MTPGNQKPQRRLSAIRCRSRAAASGPDGFDAENPPLGLLRKPHSAAFLTWSWDAVCSCFIRRLAHRSDDAIGGSGQSSLEISLRVSEARCSNSFPCCATTGKGPSIRGPPRILMQLPATRQRAAAVRTGPPRRRTRRLSKDSESCWPCGHLSGERTWKEADHQPAQLARVSPMPDSVPARAQPTTAQPGANTVTMLKPTPAAACSLIVEGMGGAVQGLHQLSGHDRNALWRSYRTD